MKIKIRTLGCKVNQYESQAIAEQFSCLGHQVTNKTADLYLINTCSVTKTADKKAKKMILQAKKENPEAKIAASGCLAEANKIFLKKLGVNYIIPQKDKPGLVKTILGLDQFNTSLKNIWDFQIKEYPRKRAFVKIQDGCDLFCSFCKIPYLRPKPTSRKKEDIIKEIKKLSFKHKEIILCGINSTLYGKDLTPKSRLADLSEEILKLKCLGRLRLSSLQPLLVDSKLISLISHPKMCPHLHLSFQYGHDSILKAMNKKETVSLYLKKVEEIRKINPQAAISCDIMIGFPGEDKKTFKENIAFLKAARPMRTHIFTFSPREKTPLAGSATLNPALLKERHRILSRLTEKLSFEYYNSFFKKKLEMVAEERKNGLTSGYTQNYIRVNLKQKKSQKLPRLGSLVKVKINEINQKNEVFAQTEF